MSIDYNRINVLFELKRNKIIVLVGPIYCQELVLNWRNRGWGGYWSCPPPFKIFKVKKIEYSIKNIPKKNKTKKTKEKRGITSI